MFGTIRKHQTWLWVFLVAVMSLGLFLFFTPNAFDDRRGGPGDEGDNGSFNGKRIRLADYQDALKEIRIASYLHTGKWPDRNDNDDRIHSETVSRVFIVHKAKEMGIKASDVAVARMIQDQLHDYPYDKLDKEILQPNGVGLADYERYVRNEAAIRQLISAASVSARLVGPTDVEEIWRKQNQESLGRLACFWASNYLSKVAITNGAISNFYNNRIGVYMIPDRVTLSYAAFPVTNYLADADTQLAKITNLNEIVSDRYFQGMRVSTNAWTDTNGVPLAEEAAKTKIKEDFRHNFALVAARRAANEFGNELLTQTNANDVSNLDRIATARGLAVRTTPPFVVQPVGSWTNGLEEFDNEPVPGSGNEETEPQGLRDVIRQKAAALTDNRPILFSPVLGRNAVYVLAKKSKLPSETQPLDKIVDKVTKDFKSYAAYDLARNAALVFHTNLTNGLKLNKTFAEICAAEKVPVIDLPPFSPSTSGLTNVDPRVNLRQIQSMAGNMEIGQAGRFSAAQPPSEGGYIFYLASRPSIDPGKLKEELPEFLSRVRVMRQNEAFQQWFRKVADQGKLSGRKREGQLGQN